MNDNDDFICIIIVAIAVMIGVIIGLGIIGIYDKCAGDETMELNITIKVTTKDHIMGSDLGEFEKELKDRIETALYVELKDDYIKNENIDLEFAVE